MRIAVTALVVMVVVMCAVYALPYLACRIGLMDEPDTRKCHEGLVPLVGGLAMFCGFIAGLCLLDAPLARFPILTLGGLVLVLIGVMDDLKELRKRVRVPAQILVALLMILVGEHVLQDVGWLSFGSLLSLGILAIPFTVFCTVGVLNAVNMSDGLDGLAGGLALITLGSLSYLAYYSGHSEDLDILVVLMACIVGFLVFNARSPWCKKAKVFMGDAGSMFLGFAIARFLIDFSQGDQRIMHPVIALWIFAVPLMDTVAVMIRRKMAGQSPFSADRQHLHHLLLAAGFSVGHTVMIIWAFAVILASIGILGHLAEVSDGVMFVSFLGLFSVYMLFLSYLGKSVGYARQVSEQKQTTAIEQSGQL